MEKKEDKRASIICTFYICGDMWAAMINSTAWTVGIAAQSQRVALISRERFQFTLPAPTIRKPERGVASF